MENGCSRRIKSSVGTHGTISLYSPVIVGAQSYFCFFCSHATCGESVFHYCVLERASRNEYFRVPTLYLILRLRPFSIITGAHVGG
ncbi:hypothetical protein NDU88_000136 [Pleurodeles waltl]|uniref:Uncharacterized protein n=1 Tax=Pleurodeles waltl TaxID=8319 RepID=A0AAV7VT93_PLEWA|nr:hypothetical protein NDU88_000136 [Pleurodeles waltl]